MAMEKRIFGKTGLEVSPLGFGAAQLGYLDVSQAECDRILNGVLDAGISVLDTAAGYPGSEEKIGQAVGHRRADYVLITKCGQHIDPDDPPEWTPEVVRHSIERSLRRLRTDHVDAVLLHSCTMRHLKNDAMIEALMKCKDEGKTRLIGYSGDHKDAEYAIGMNVFDCVETSLSICDQQVIEGNLPRAREAGLGVMTKRTLANSAWRGAEGLGEMYSQYARPYIDRLQKMNFTPKSIGFDGDWAELALRFAAFQPGVSLCLIGGRNLDHITENIRFLEHGPLPENVHQRLRELWQEHDDGSWVGQV